MREKPGIEKRVIYAYVQLVCYVRRRKCYCFVVSVRVCCVCDIFDLLPFGLALRPIKLLLSASCHRCH